VENNVWERIEQARSRWNVLDHPFYQRWSAGELTPEDLAEYSGQYRHAVEAVAAVSGYVAAEVPEAGLDGHAREEVEHVALWDGFVEAVGGSVRARPNAETTGCVEEWSRRGGAVPALARLYAIESGQPAISRTKLEGLAEHYGIASGNGTVYFRLHEGRDVEHAAEGREVLERLLDTPELEDQAVAAAEGAFEANWKLLDGVC
jgi:pyrroloquinoline-quinone synthase